MIVLKNKFMSRIYQLTFLFALFFIINAQAQKIILGDDESNITITSSDSWSPLYAYDSASAGKTVGSIGLMAKQFASSRFLHQATLGFTENDIKDVTRMGFEQWIDHQIKAPHQSILSISEKAFKDAYDWYFVNHTDSTRAPSYFSALYFNYAFWENHLKNKDRLRQRVALALSEILVVSINSELVGNGRAIAHYYDLLLNHAFGNYKDLLRDVSLSPVMGYYLSHLNNPKEIPEENIHPDENYAREIMQLFTIGLYELNLDGSRKLDPQGNPIPSYSQADIKEMAKVFTGLGFSKVMPNQWVDTASFGTNYYLGDLLSPMRMYDEWHQPGEKKLMNGFTIQAGQKGMKDVEDAIHFLIKHPNIGPFISKQLIQRLVKSNPTPGYIRRVASVFNDDGNGVKGNLAAVVKAILLDNEARDCEWLSDPKNGQLREPFVRYTHFASPLDVEQYYGRYWNSSFDYLQNVGQIPMASPTVFNFFLPSFSPLGEIKKNGLVAPEFQLHNSRTAIGYVNYVNNWAVYNYLFYSWEEFDPATYLNTTELQKLAREPETLINKLDLLYTYGNLSDRTRGIIKEALNSLVYGNYREERVRMALYLLCISPDFTILK